jgi:hypothetical protein
MYHPDMGTLAQFVGEQPYESPAFVPGVDFDPWDPEEVEIVGLATEIHRHDKMRRLEEENSRLRARLAELTDGNE